MDVEIQSYILLLLAIVGTFSFGYVFSRFLGIALKSLFYILLITGVVFIISMFTEYSSNDMEVDKFFSHVWHIVKVVFKFITESLIKGGILTVSSTFFGILLGLYHKHRSRFNV